MGLMLRDFNGKLNLDYIMCFHDFLFMIRQIIESVILKRFPICFCVYFLVSYNSLIFFTSCSVSLAKCESIPLFGVCNPVVYECAWFSLLVAHSKFSILLSDFTPFLWFTSGLLYGFGINNLANIIWVKCDFFIPFLCRFIFLYPLLFIVCLRILDIILLYLSLSFTNLFKLLIRLKLLASYIPSYSLIGIQISPEMFSKERLLQCSIKIKKRLNKLKGGRLSHYKDASNFFNHALPQAFSI